MKLIPKKNKLAIPGIGVVDKKDFNTSHVNILKGWCLSKNIPWNGIVKKHFDIVLDDGQVSMPMIELSGEIEKPKRKRRTKAEMKK